MANFLQAADEAQLSQPFSPQIHNVTVESLTFKQSEVGAEKNWLALELVFTKPAEVENAPEYRFATMLFFQSVMPFVDVHTKDKVNCGFLLNQLFTSLEGKPKRDQSIVDSWIKTFPGFDNMTLEEFAAAFNAYLASRESSMVRVKLTGRHDKRTGAVLANLNVYRQCIEPVGGKILKWTQEDVLAPMVISQAQSPNYGTQPTTNAGTPNYGAGSYGD